MMEFAMLLSIIMIMSVSPHSHSSPINFTLLFKRLVDKNVSSVILCVGVSDVAGRK